MQARRTGHPDREIKRLTVPTRFMTSFQQGMLTLKKLRHGGQQKISVQHINVSEGGQAKCSQSAWIAAFVLTIARGF